jgi:MinD-like ATPase involved in chromosome partitioning or flagellar assembly
MEGDRYVVVGLARARTDWFTEVSRWAQSGRIPVEFIKCVSAAELHARLSVVGAVSAVLIDAGAPGADRDLVGLSRHSGAAVLVVDDGRPGRDWPAIGASAVLPPGFDATMLVERLEATAAPISPRGPRRDPVIGSPRAEFSGSLVAVCGVPGGGASTVAVAVAQGLADRGDGGGGVVLADLALSGEQASYHGARDVVPGLQELVDAHRGGRPDRSAVRAMTYQVESRRYTLLLGLRRSRDWTALPPQATDAALASLRNAYRWVVADVTSDLDGEADTGSLDLEERNHLARSSVGGAQAVVVVGTPGVRGVRGLLNLVDGVAALGVDPDRIIAVVNHAPRSAAARREVVRAVAHLGPAGLRPPMTVRSRREMEAIHHTVDPLPRQLCQPLATAVYEITAAASSPVAAPATPVPLLATRTAS